MGSPQDNKKLVMDFLNEVVRGEGAEAAFDKYCHPTNYIQHNPRLVNGKEGFLEFARSASLCEGFTLEIRRMAAEDDLVWMQGVMTGFHWPDEPNPVDPKSLRHALMDIFRVKDGKLVEHWDIYQRIPPYTANGNDMV